jgi:cytoskeletal protein RodZ
MEPDLDMGIGATLRNAREQKGLSVDECADTTRIRRKYLDALEEEQYAALPEPAYARGFLRTYATMLGVDAARMVELYDQSATESAPSSGSLELRAREAPRPGGGGERRSNPRGRRMIWFAVGVLAVVALGYLAARGVAVEPAVPYFSR